MMSVLAAIGPAAAAPPNSHRAWAHDDLAACYALSAGVDEDVFAPINSFGRGDLPMDQVESKTNLSSPSTLPAVAGLAAARPERRSRLTPTGLAPLGSPAYRYLFVGTALTMAGYFMQ